MERALFHSLLECRQIPGGDLEAKGLQVDRECLGDFGVDRVDSFNASGADIISLFCRGCHFCSSVPCSSYSQRESFHVHQAHFVTCSFSTAAVSRSISFSLSSVMLFVAVIFLVAAGTCRLGNLSLYLLLRSPHLSDLPCSCNKYC